MKIINLNQVLFERFLSTKTRRKSERVILVIAIVSFMIHLVLIYLTQFGYINIDPESPLFKNPIAAIYTPFSFILIYEIYLLIYYLPKSITNYIGKQYEIITLIIIRRLLRICPHWNYHPIGFRSRMTCNSLMIWLHPCCFFIFYICFLYRVKKDTATINLHR